MIFIQSRYIPDPGIFITSAPPGSTKILQAKIASGSPYHITGNIYIKTDRQGVGSWCMLGAKMCFPCMDCKISILSQDFRECFCINRSFNPLFGRQTVHIPHRSIQFVIPSIVGCIHPQGPVCNLVSRCIHPCHQAYPGRRTYGTGIGIRKLHPLGGKFFHIGCAKTLIDRCFLKPERNGSILPAHIIYQKQDNIGFFKGFPAA